MNNAKIIEDMMPEEKNPSPLLISRAEVLTDIIEALQNVAGSSYWKVLSKNVFDVERAKSKKRLEVESDTAEIFRLQGETRLGRRYHLDNLLIKYRNELQAIKKQI